MSRLTAQVPGAMNGRWTSPWTCSPTKPVIFQPARPSQLLRQPFAGRQLPLDGHSTTSSTCSRSTTSSAASSASSSAPAADTQPVATNSGGSSRNSDVSLDSGCVSSSVETSWTSSTRRRLQLVDLNVFNLSATGPGQCLVAFFELMPSFWSSCFPFLEFMSSFLEVMFMFPLPAFICWPPWSIPNEFVVQILAEIFPSFFKNSSLQLISIFLSDEIHNLVFSYNSTHKGPREGKKR